MFEKIVLATDLSPAWDEIVACAGEVKARGVKEVLITHVITVKFMAGLADKLRQGFIKELFLGSVAHNVSWLAPCPVLLIPPPQR